MSKDSMILDVALSYVPENADIQQIRFVDEKIDGVIDYDTCLLYTSELMRI